MKTSKILFFYTEGCGYCKQLSPQIEEIQKLNFIKIEKILGSENKDLVAEYDVKYYPTMIFKEKVNKKLYKLVGKNKIENFIKNIKN